jgi:hypothetical protein
LQQLEIGYDALKAKIVKAPDGEAGKLFGDLIKLKEGEGMFTIVEGGIRHAPTPGGREQIATGFLLPPKAPVGEYLVELYGFKDGSGTLLGSGSITLEQDHLIRYITSMVGNHSLLYGCLAVMVAIVAGLLTRVTFAWAEVSTLMKWRSGGLIMKWRSFFTGGHQKAGLDYCAPNSKIPDPPSQNNRVLELMAQAEESLRGSSF